MDGPTLNLLSRFRAQVVSDVKSKLKDDSSSDTETENGPIETEDESETKTGCYTGSDTGSMTDSSICEPQPDTPGPRPTAILRRKSMVTSLGDGTSGLRRRNNVLRRRSDNFGVTFETKIPESEDERVKNDKPDRFNGRRKSVMFDLKASTKTKPLSNQKRRQSILKSPRKASMASTDASTKSVRFNDSDSDESSS